MADCLNRAPCQSAMPLGRRRVIGLLGGGLVLATTGLTACSSEFPAASVQAWQPPAEGADVRRFMLAHALLAPNPHNRQPWLADLRREGEITLVCDKDRLLPETDPFGRQILIGCGAFIELAVMAGAERGYRVQVEPFPDGEPGTRDLPGGRAVARLKLLADPAMPRDPLFAQIRRRHTHKGVYDSARRVPDSAWQALAAAPKEYGLLTGDIADAARIGKVRMITRASFEAEVTTARTWLESARLMRIGPDEIERHRDGISMMGAMPRLASGLGLFDRFEVPARGSSNFERTMEVWQPQESGSGYFWIASRGNSRRSQLDCGRAYVRAQLQATADGLDMHPLSQALQEFSEVRAQHEALHRLLSFDPAQTTVQMLARVGYGLKPVQASPRRELGQLLRA